MDNQKTARKKSFEFGSFRRTRKTLLLCFGAPNAPPFPPPPPCHFVYRLQLDLAQCAMEGTLFNYDDVP